MLVLLMFISSCDKENITPQEVINVNIDSVINKVNDQKRQNIDSIYKHIVINFTLITVKQFNYNIIDNKCYYNIELINYALLDKEINVVVKFIINNDVYISDVVNLTISKSKEIKKNKEYIPTTLQYSDSIIINKIDNNIKIYYSINAGVDWILIK